MRAWLAARLNTSPDRLVPRLLVILVGVRWKFRIQQALCRHVFATYAVWTGRVGDASPPDNVCIERRCGKCWKEII